MARATLARTAKLTGQYNLILGSRHAWMKFSRCLSLPPGLPVNTNALVRFLAVPCGLISAEVGLSGSFKVIRALACNEPYSP